MKRLETRLHGPMLLEPEVFGDARGFFVETYRRHVFAELGIPEEMVQHNQSRSAHGVVRGMHFQIGEGTSKLVRCARGAIYDVVVDVRTDSPAFGEWEGYELNEDNGHIAYCPVGFAHGFCVVSEVADVLYLQSNYYVPELERGFAYDDSDVGIEWPLLPETIQVSDRDTSAPTLAEIKDELPFRI